MSGARWPRCNLCSGAPCSRQLLLSIYQYKKGEKGADPRNHSHQINIQRIKNRPSLTLKQSKTDNPIANQTASDSSVKKNASDSFSNLISARDDPGRSPANVAVRPQRQDLHLCIHATARPPCRRAARRPSSR
jgi:hypothetical protein